MRFENAHSVGVYIPTKEEKQGACPTVKNI